MVVRWLAIRQARVPTPARHPREVTPTEPAAMKLWRRASANVERVNVCIVTEKINIQEECHKAFSG
jgi:hypothetical protein